jgi:hypothetical protein
MKSAMDGGDLTSSANKIQMMAKNVLGGRFEIVVAMVLVLSTNIYSSSYNSFDFVFRTTLHTKITSKLVSSEIELTNRSKNFRMERSAR